MFKLLEQYLAPVSVWLALVNSYSFIIITRFSILISIVTSLDFFLVICQHFRDISIVLLNDTANF